MSAKTRFLEFEKARKFARNQKIKNEAEWRNFRKNENKPSNVPSRRDIVYKGKGWSGYSDWLGVGTIAKNKIAFLSFEGEKASNILSNPNATYKNKGRKGYSDCSRTGNIVLSDKKFIQFKEARAYAHSLNLKNMREWCAHSTSGNRPPNIPFWPDKIYAGKGWQNWGDFLGTGNVAGNKEFLCFKDARLHARALGLKSQNAWRGYSKSRLRPKNIPSCPNMIYGNSGWAGWNDWLGISNTSFKNVSYRSFKRARQFVQKLGLKNQKEWVTYCKEGNKPRDLPSSPQTVYKDDGWDGYGDWLGTGRIALHWKKFLSFEKAREITHSFNLRSVNDWVRFCKSGNKPLDIPSRPEHSYKNKGWKNWYDWLGVNH